MITSFSNRTNTLSPFQLRAAHALKSSAGKSNPVEERGELLAGLRDVADLAPGSLESQFATTVSNALQQVSGETLSLTAASTALDMIQGGISGPLGASIAKFGRCITDSSVGRYDFGQTNKLSSALLQTLEPQPSTSFSRELLNSSNLTEHSKNTVANIAFFYASKTPNTVYHRGDDSTRKAGFALDVGRSLERHGATRPADITTIYQSALPPEQPPANDNLEKQFKERLTALMTQSPEGKSLLDYQERLYGTA